MDPTQPIINPVIIRRVLVGAFAAILIFLIANFFLTNGQLVVNAQGKDGTEITLTLTRNGKEVEKTKITQFDQQSFWLPVGEYTISLDQGYRNSLATAQVQPLGKKTVTLATRDEAASIKLAGESLGCGTVAGGIYYSYDCLKQTSIYKNTDAGKVVISDDKYDTVVPFSAGLIVSSLINGKVVFSYLDPSNNQKNDITIPANLQSNLKQYDLVAIPNQKKDSLYQFALVFRSSNTWYLYNNLKDQNPKIIKTGDTKNGLLPVSNQLFADQLVTFFGPKPPDEGQEQTAKSTGGALTVYSLAKNQIANDIILPNDTAFDGFQLLSPTTAVAQITNGGLSIYSLNQGSLNKIGTFNNGKNLAINEGRAIFSSDSNIYELHAENATANRLFSANGFSASSLGLSDGFAIIQTFTGQSGQANSGLPTAIGLDLSKSATYPRPEWNLPNSTQNINYIGFDNLLNHGISSYQIDDLKFAIINYTKSTGKDLANAVVDGQSIATKPRARTSIERDEVSFNLAINNQAVLKARMQFFDVSGIHLYLSDSTGKIVYDSQDLDISK